MGETKHKIAISNNKLTVTPNNNALLGPLYTLLEKYLLLDETQKREVDEYMASLLEKRKMTKESFAKIKQKSSVDADLARIITSLKTKKDRILFIVKHRANPLFLSARDIQELYQHYLHPEKIGISTIQTNLNRLSDAGLVERREGDPIEYRVNPLRVKEFPQVVLD